MGTEIIHGRVEPTEPDRTKWGYGYYRTMRIHEVSGKPRDLHKVSAGGAVREAIARGAEGSFHLSSHAGMRGIHGVKLADGTRHYAHFNNLEKMMMALAVIAVVLLVLFLRGMEVPLLAVIVGLIFAAYLPFARRGRLEAEREFHAA